MNISAKIALKYLIMQKKASAFCTAGILFSTMLITLLSVGLSTLMRFAYRSSTESTGNVHGIISAPPQYAQDIIRNAVFEEADVYTVAVFKSFYEHYLREEGNVLIYSSSFEPGNFYEFVSADFSKSRLTDTFSQSLRLGNFPENENDIVIPEEMLDAFGNPSPGDEVLFSFKLYKIDGGLDTTPAEFIQTAEPIQEFSVPLKLCGITSDQNFLISPENSFFKDMAQTQTARISVRFKQGVGLLENAVSQVFSDIGASDALYTFDENTPITYAEFIGTRAKVFAICAFCVLLVAVLALLSYCRVAVSSAFEIITGQNLKQYGILKSAGISPSQMTQLILIQASALSAAGIIPGIGGGLWFSAVLYRLVSGSRAYASIAYYTAQSSLRLYIPPYMLLALVLIAMIWVILSSLSTAKRVIKCTPAQAMSQACCKTQPLPRKYGRFIRKIAGSIGLLALRNMGADRKMGKSMLFSLTMSISIYVMMSSALSLYTDFYKAEAYDITAAFAGDTSEAEAALTASGFFSQISLDSIIGAAESETHSRFRLKLKNAYDYQTASDWLLNTPSLREIGRGQAESHADTLRFLVISSVGRGIIAISAVIVILNLVNLISAGIHRRKREIAMLRAMGMSKRQLLRMFLTENVLYTFAALLLSLLCVSFAALSFYLLTGGNTLVFSSFLLEVYLRTILTGLSALGLAFLATLLPLRNTTAGTIAETLKYI